jgi:FtsZ-binding cell division protein ZapB
VFAVLLALGAIDQRRRKALSKLQEEIDEIKEQLAELESKVSNLQPEREIELNDRDWDRQPHQRHYDSNAPRPTPEPGWKMSLTSYPLSQAERYKKSWGPNTEAIRLIPDSTRPGEYWLTLKPKPKTSETPTSKNRVDDSDGQA